MDWKKKVEMWLSHESINKELQAELKEMQKSEKILEESFYKNLEFGTGGIRGEIGPGTNRINIYTIRKAAKGLADYLIDKGEGQQKRGVVIAYDSRHKSEEFALEVAKTLGKQGIKSYVFDKASPTPVLSFAVRYLNSAAGVVITASHNPPEYNGFKVYGEVGGQIPPSKAEAITNFIDAVDNELNVCIMEETDLLKKGLLTYIGEEIERAYIQQLKTIQLNRNLVEELGEDLKIVFSPLHGTAYHLVFAGLKAFGFKNITFVKEQLLPDPNFSTVKYPNPEEPASFNMAIQYGKKINADILMATDPDSDRLGVAVKNNKGQYILLSGNELGAIMLHYLLAEKKSNGSLPKNGVVIKTIVTSEIGRMIASSFDLQTIDTLTGFKFIGEKINELEQTQKLNFQFGYEESFGYLIGSFVRDKDAIQAAVFAAEVASYYKKQGKTLYEGLIEIYKKYGFFKESLQSLTIKGKEGAKHISKILSSLRKNSPEEINGVKIKFMEDYQTSKRINMETGEGTIIQLPKSNVLKFYLEDESWFTIRPSGTEPKVKFYFSVRGSSMTESEQLLDRLQNNVMKIIKEIVSFQN